MIKRIIIWLKVFFNQGGGTILKNGKNKYLTSFFAIIMAVITFVTMSHPTVVEAVYDLNTAPTGMTYQMMTQYFDAPKIFPVTDSSGNVSYKNGFTNGYNAFSEDASNVNSALINLWGTSTPQGFIWSKDDYGLDTTKDQTVSMWLYDAQAGPAAGTKTDVNGGVAFVLQNDPRGTNAYSSLVQGSLPSSETLGVWADDTYPVNSSDSSLRTGAIQNSWAVELDFENNASGKSNDSFDNGVYTGTAITPGEMHIASNYPAKASTYNLLGRDSLGKSIYSMNHVGSSIHNMSDAALPSASTVGGGEWHHFTVEYKKPEEGSTVAHITYKLNDINRDGSANTNTGADTQTNPVESSYTAAVNLNNFKLSSGQKLRWGLVGRGDNPSASVSIVMDKATNLTQARVTPEVYDVTQNKVITKADNFVSPGDVLNLKYHAEYESGQKSWAGITSFIYLSNKLTPVVSNNSIGTVQYALNGSSTSSDSFTGKTVDTTYGYVKQAFSKSLDSTTNNQADVTINVTVPKTDADGTKISGIKGLFRGDSASESATTLDMVVKKPVTKSLQISSDSDSAMDVLKGTGATITGSVSYTPASNFDSTGAILYSKIGDDDPTTQALSYDSTNPQKINFSTKINDGLVAGYNSVVIYARDASGNESNHLTFLINVIAKSLNLVIGSNNYSFKDITGYKTGIIGRKGNWNDIYVDAQDSKWKLTGTADSLKDSLGNQFNGSLMYIDQDGNKNKFDKETPILMHSSTTDEENTKTYISNLWNSDTGILLNSNGGGIIGGTYSTTINWELIDSD